MAAANLPSPDLLRQLIAYDAETGLLQWKRRPVHLFKTADSCRRWNARYAGTEALTCISHGYKTGRIFRISTSAHRVAWTLTHGRWPVAIDHINGDRCDNRISNLREATQAENMKNACIHKNNTSGQSGVRWRDDTKKWQARIHVNAQEISLGWFATFEEAVAARKAAEQVHGYHVNHGRTV